MDRRYARLILNIVIPTVEILLVCLEIFYAICDRLDHCHDCQPAGPFFGEQGKIGT